MSKLVRLTLALALLIAGLTTTAPRPQVALASPSCPVAVQPAGAGTATDPYRIATPEHLMWLSAQSGEWGKEFIQVDDIDFGGALAGCDGNKGWSPIGTSGTPFTGVYDGQGHSISRLFINRFDGDDDDVGVGVGFFGRTVGAEIRHLHLIAVGITGRNQVGALIGTNRAGSKTTVVYDVSATGEVESKRTGPDAADTGGLFGYTYNINITFARADVAVTAVGRNVGGLVGDGTTGTTISRSWATGSVTSTGTQGQVGGLAGLFRGSGSGIYDSYATGAIIRGGALNPGAGGLIGRLESSSVERSYATGAVTGSPSTACDSNCNPLIGTGTGTLVGLPDSNLEGAVRARALADVPEPSKWNLTAVWSLPDDSGLPTLRTPPGRPVVSQLVRVGEDVSATVGSVAENGLTVTGYEVRTGDTWVAAPGPALSSPFEVAVDPSADGPRVLRVRAVSGAVPGPSISLTTVGFVVSLPAGAWSRVFSPSSLEAAFDGLTGELRMEVAVDDGLLILPVKDGLTVPSDATSPSLAEISDVSGSGATSFVVEGATDDVEAALQSLRHRRESTGSTTLSITFTSVSGRGPTPGLISTTITTVGGGFGEVRTSDYGTTPISGGAFFWRGYRFQVAEPTLVTHLIGGGRDTGGDPEVVGKSPGDPVLDKELNAPGKVFKGAIFDTNVGTFTAKSVLGEVSFPTNQVNQVAALDAPVLLEPGQWYILAQGSVAGTVYHWYVSELDGQGLIEASARISDWFPTGAGGVRTLYWSGGNREPSGLINQSFGDDSSRPALGFRYASAVALPTVVTNRVDPSAPETDPPTRMGPLSVSLTEVGGGPTSLFLEYGATAELNTGTTLLPLVKLYDGALPLDMTPTVDVSGTNFTFTYTIPGAGPVIVSLPQSTTRYWRARGINDGGRIDGDIFRLQLPAAAVGSSGVAVDFTSEAAIPDRFSEPPSQPTITGVTPGNQSLNVAFLSSSGILNVAYQIDGGDWVTRSPATPVSPLLIQGLENGVEYSVRIRVINENGTSVGSLPVNGTPAAPPPAPTPPVTLEPIRPPLPPGPVLTAGAPPRPSPAPTARVGEREVIVAPTPAGTTRTEGTTTVSTATILEVGTIALALDVTGAGEVRTVVGAAPQVTIVRDAVARTSGGGLLPGTQVQAWLPLDGGNARPVVNLPVREDGTFTGELPFDGRTDRQTDGRPLPIGTHVLQLVGVDATGQITVIEQTIRIEQPSPAPEPDRRAGAPPTLSPGASIATNAGIPEAVRVVPVPEVRQARVEGTGWTMAVDIPSADGRVAPAEGGGALIELVEDDVAEVSGDGFLPGTRADVWLFSTPTLLGTVTIGPDGSFSGQVPVAGIATGEHTLQLQGVGSDGYVRAANLGVAVVPRAADEPAPEPEPEPQPEATPEPAPERPADSVEVVTASGPEPTGSSLLVWIALLAAVLGSGGWWFLIGRRRRDDEDEAHQG